MKINNYLITLTITIIMIFGGVFIIKYSRTGDLFLDQLIPALVGIILLIALLVWRTKHKNTIGPDIN